MQRITQTGTFHWNGDDGLQHPGQKTHPSQADDCTARPYGMVSPRPAGQFTKHNARQV
jgi:hypothetical protein